MLRFMLILLAFALTTLSMPTGWSEDEAKFYSAVGKEIQKFRGSGIFGRPRGCDISEVKLPQTSEPLPDIPHGQKLLAVAVGRGTQVRPLAAKHNFEPLHTGIVIARLTSCNAYRIIPAIQSPKNLALRVLSRLFTMPPASRQIIHISCRP